MSAFALPIPPAGLAPRLRRPTERSATTPEIRDQRSEIGDRRSQIIGTAAIQRRKHPGNLPVPAPPALGHLARDIAEIPAIEHPYLHLVGRPQRHHHKPAKLRSRDRLAAK